MVQSEKTRAVNLAWNVPGAVYMGRAGRGEDGYFGNRFAKNVPGSLELFEDDFAERVAKDGVFRRRVFALEGKPLACPGNCKPGRCHVDVYVAWIEAKREELEERAAILEHDAGMTWAAAEREARRLLGLDEKEPVHGRS
jgi:hypothetical protein